MAETYYRKSLYYSWTHRRYFRCGALTGLVRVKYEQKDFSSIPKLLAQAERLAQYYEFNNHLASLRLIQGHVAWNTSVPKWGGGLDTVLHYYQEALIYALRYNRFLLDEILSGAITTPIQPIITHCQQQGDLGRQALNVLLNWWRSGTNTISAEEKPMISRVLPLIKAEHIARERELGNGLLQTSVVDQIEQALVSF